MEKQITIAECFKLNQIINNIISQELSLSANTAYHFFLLNKTLNNIEDFVFKRMEKIFGENFDITKFNNEEKIVYNTILNSVINVELLNVHVDEFLNTELKLKIDDFNFLKYIYEK